MQTFRGLIQPKRGKLLDEPEGEVESATHVLYCNIVTQPSNGLPTDIKAADCIVSQGLLGLTKYRVVFVADEGGQADHFKVYLSTKGIPGD